MQVLIAENSATPRTHTALEQVDATATLVAVS